MKGIAAGEPGQVQVVDFPDPRLETGGVVLAPLACGICSTDVKQVKQGAKDTKYALGHEVAGWVIAADPLSGWKIGQRVVAAPYLPCGKCFYCQHQQPALCEHLYDVCLYPGGLAEQIGIPAELARRGMFPIPDGLASDLAAISEPVGCVVKGLEDARQGSGDTVLVVGDGPMGLFTAAVARLQGASSVLVAGMTPSRLAFAAEHYADRVVDLSQEELLPVVKQATSGRGADVVMVAVSNGDALSQGIRCVRPGGVVNAFAGVSSGTQIPLDVRQLHYQQYYLTGSSGVCPEHLEKALNLIGQNPRVFSPMVTARFPFERSGEAVKYAMDRVGLKAVVTFKE